MTDGKCLARRFHESPAATEDMTVLPGVLGCSFDRLRTGSPCDVPLRYASEPIPRYRGTVARWHAHLRGLATAIHDISGLAKFHVNGQFFTLSIFIITDHLRAGSRM